LRGAPGFGPVLSSAVIAGVGNAAQFGSAREMAAWLGLTPRAEASGDRSVLKGISKRGNRYLRTLFIHGARAVVNWCGTKSDPLSLWLQKQKLLSPDQPVMDLKVSDYLVEVRPPRTSASRMP